MIIFGLFIVTLFSCLIMSLGAMLIMTGSPILEALRGGIFLMVLSIALIYLFVHSIWLEFILAGGIVFILSLISRLVVEQH